MATLFRKLETLKHLVTLLSKTQPFRAPFHSQHFKGSKTRLNSATDHFIILFHHSERN